MRRLRNRETTHRQLISAMKRRRHVLDDSASPPTKRPRCGSTRSLVDLSPEIILRSLEHLPVQQLVLLERVSKGLRRLASDSQIWRTKYYETFIEPRSRRIPVNVRPDPIKLTRWLEHGQALRTGEKVDWKKRYKLRSNWQRGDARLHEVELAKPSAPAVLAQVYNGLVVTADTVHGLRLWSQACGSKKLEAQVALSPEPSALAVGSDWIVVAFQDGNIRCYAYDASTIRHAFDIVDGTSSIRSLALAKTYLVAMSDDRDIRLYQLDEVLGKATSLTSLHADTALQAAALSLRCTSSSVIATVAYAFNRLGDGWCLGLQEIRLSKDDGAVNTRTASNIDTPLDSLYRGPNRWEITSRSAYSTPLTTPFSLGPELKQPPTSLAYCHPFLLASLADNTIMSYIVQSDDAQLDLSSGKRLFGHTSAITSAEVSNRGKAVSVSARGNEIRVWELEDVLTTARGRVSTQVKSRDAAMDVAAALSRRGSGLGLALKEMKRELAMTRRSVSFDDEQIVVLGSSDQRQYMACYDFS